MGGFCPYCFNFNKLGMEHTESIIKDNAAFIHPNEYDQASNSYLMAVVAVIAGLPVPIVNVIAAIGFYLGHRRSSYFVRWHCIQSAIGQAILIPFNSIAFAWTMGILLGHNSFLEIADNDGTYQVTGFDFSAPSGYYWMYILFILILNITEFFVVIYTASRVRNGHNVRWPLIAGIADSLCSKENRTIYK